jgi:hypothetical protein
MDSPYGGESRTHTESVPAQGSIDGAWSGLLTDVKKLPNADAFIRDLKTGFKMIREGGTDQVCLTAQRDGSIAIGTQPLIGRTTGDHVRNQNVPG